MILEDKRLIRQVKSGDSGALCKIYQKYGDSLMTAAACILRNKSAAEDVVHDVFLSFVEGIKGFRLTGSLNGYLATCVANLARDKLRAVNPKGMNPGNIEQASIGDPEQIVIENEQLQQVYDAIDQLPLEQREAIMLHLQGGVKFKELARAQEVSINTVQGRYRYGIKKLRSILNVEV